MEKRSHRAPTWNSWGQPQLTSSLPALTPAAAHPSARHFVTKWQTLTQAINHQPSTCINIHQHRRHHQLFRQKARRCPGVTWGHLGARLEVTGSWSNCGHQLSYWESCVRWNFKVTSRWFQGNFTCWNWLEPNKIWARLTINPDSSQATGVLRWLEGHTTHPAVVTRLWQSDPDNIWWPLSHIILGECVVNSCEHVTIRYDSIRFVPLISRFHSTSQLLESRVKRTMWFWDKLVVCSITCHIQHRFSLPGNASESGLGLLQHIVKEQALQGILGKRRGRRS